LKNVTDRLNRWCFIIFKMLWCASGPGLDIIQLLLLKLLHDYQPWQALRRQHRDPQWVHKIWHWSTLLLKRRCGVSLSIWFNLDLVKEKPVRGKRSCQRVNQAWDKLGRHGFWSQEKFPNLVLRNLKTKKYSTLQRSIVWSQRWSEYDHCPYYAWSSLHRKSRTLCEFKSDILSRAKIHRTSDKRARFSINRLTPLNTTKVKVLL